MALLYKDNPECNINLSLLRQSGDIDVCVKGGFNVVNAFVQKTRPTDDIAYHRFYYNMYPDTEVELHHCPTLMRNLFDDRRLQRWYDSFGADTFFMTGKGLPYLLLILIAYSFLPISIGIFFLKE